MVDKQGLKKRSETGSKWPDFARLPLHRMNQAFLDKGSIIISQTPFIFGKNRLTSSRVSRLQAIDSELLRCRGFRRNLIEGTLLLCREQLADLRVMLIGDFAISRRLHFFRDGSVLF